MARLHGLLRSTALSQAKNEPGVAESAMCLGLLCELLTGLGRLVLKMAGWGWAQVMCQDGIAASLDLL